MGAVASSTTVILDKDGLYQSTTTGYPGVVLIDTGVLTEERWSILRRGRVEVRKKVLSP